MWKRGPRLLSPRTGDGVVTWTSESRSEDRGQKSRFLNSVGFFVIRETRTQGPFRFVPDLTDVGGYQYPRDDVSCHPSSGVRLSVYGGVLTVTGRLRLRWVTGLTRTRSSCGVGVTVGHRKVEV